MSLKAGSMYEPTPHELSRHLKNATTSEGTHQTKLAKEDIYLVVLTNKKKKRCHPHLEDDPIEHPPLKLLKMRE